MTSRRTVILGLAATSLAAPASAAAKFRPLFDGRSLDGWTRLGDANWAVTGGAMAADKGGADPKVAGFLMSRDSFRDFDLRAEFWVSPDANSGIFIRCTDRTQVTASNAYECNIYDQRPDPSYGTGAIVGVAKVSPMPKAGGRWSVMEVSARGDVFSVSVNGQKTVDNARDGAHAEGPIALQYGSGVVKFRRVDVRTA